MPPLHLLAAEARGRAQGSAASCRTGLPIGRFASPLEGKRGISYIPAMANTELERFESRPNESVETSIARVCARVEALAPASRAGVSIASADRSKLECSVFPNLPRTFQETINDLPMGAPYIGCCTAAMDGNQIITVHDVTKDGRFSDVFVRTCVDHGIKSLQSRPVYGREGKPIGTFVMGYGEPRPERDFDVALMDFAADAVGTLLQKRLDSRAP